MKKLKRVWNLVWFRLNDRKVRELEIRGFKYVFRKYSMEVRSISRNFSCTVLCSEHPWGYLRVSSEKGKEKNLEGYATLMYILGTSLTRDQKLVDDITRDVKSYYARLERKASKAAPAESEVEEMVTLFNEKQIYEKGKR